ncbi:F-box only protein 17-like isoform X2 [Paroedura picta]|uniref:F-box only protein 17-like isoform X2 n=1 Tax=Paroedura picta TaxID=143630 RepID=UPI00405637B5
MGQAESHRRAGTAPQNSHGVRSRGGLALLPEELLVLILSWVPGRILATRGRLVCRHWRDLIDSPLPWKLQAERDPSKLEGLRSALEAARRCPRLEWARVGALQPFARNLIKNPRGEDQFLHWQVGHGDGWCLGDNTCWMLQLVDLVKEGLWEDLLDTCQPDIFISEWRQKLRHRQVCHRGGLCGGVGHPLSTGFPRLQGIRPWRALPAVPAHWQPPGGAAHGSPPHQLHRPGETLRVDSEEDPSLLG